MSDHQAEMNVNWFPAIAIGVAILALGGTIFAVGRVNAIATVGPEVIIAAGEGSGPAEELEVDLSEFILDPHDLAVPVGSSLRAVNVGASPHNLEVDGADRKTPDIQPGEESVLNLADLEPGEYRLFCNLSGHASAGMEATLTIVGTGTDTADPGVTHDSGHAELSADMAADMQQAMMDSIGSFPAETEGEGAAVLEPTVMEDGTKLFDLEVSRVKWEVEPGKLVDAIAYNGIVPGPTMRADIGDDVIIRVTNSLEFEGTSLHPHGLKDHDFAIDGVTFISQDPIEPGESMDYPFTVDQEGIMTYHSHHMSLEQVPNGLFGMMILGDFAELAGIEGVVDEIPMITNDAGNIGFSLNGKSFPATTAYEYTSGDKVLVHYANEGQMAHPMHLHNQTGTVIAKDGYLLAETARYQGDTFNVSPGERLSVVYELNQPGTWVWHCHILSHVKRADGTMFGMLTAMIVNPA